MHFSKISIFYYINFSLKTCTFKLSFQYDFQVRCNAPESLEALLMDPTPEVRAAAVFALGTFIHSCSDRTEHANTVDQNIATGNLST